MMRYFVGFLAVVAMVVLVFVLVLNGFKGDRETVQTKLTDYAATQTIMRLTIDGPVSADQTHRSLTIDVGQSASTIRLHKGYNAEVIDSRTYTSNEAAYGTFLRALQLQGYTRGDADPARADSRGVCPTGRVYSFEIITGSASVQRFWATSCGSGGTFDGNHPAVRQLFRAQIPDYIRLTSGLGLN